MLSDLLYRQAPALVIPSCFAAPHSEGQFDSLDNLGVRERDTGVTFSLDELNKRRPHRRIELVEHRHRPPSNHIAKCEFDNRC